MNERAKRELLEVCVAEQENARQLHLEREAVARSKIEELFVTSN